MSLLNRAINATSRDHMPAKLSSISGSLFSAIQQEAVHSHISILLELCIARGLLLELADAYELRKTHGVLK